MSSYLCVALFLAVIGAFASDAPAFRSQDASAQLMPTEALHQVNDALAAGDRSKQGEIVRPFLGRTKKTELSPEEEMALGEIYFLALNPRDSDAIFTKYLSRTDRVGRMAWIRHQQVQFRAFDKHDDTERELPMFRKQFAVSPDDLTYTGTMVGNQANRYAAAGNHARVVELILEDVKDLPLDLPLRSFRNVGVNFASFIRVSRQGEAAALLRSHREHLQQRVSRAGSGLESASVVKKRVMPHRTGYLHADWDTANADDHERFDRDRFNTQMAMDRLQELDAMLAKIASAGH